MSFSFAQGSTRKIKVGDTPGFNDDVLSRLMKVTNLLKGTPSVIDTDGTIKLAKAADFGKTPFVPTESVDNSTAITPPRTINGVGAGQQVALKNHTDTLKVGSLVKLKDESSAPSTLVVWLKTDKNHLKYAKYIGKEAGEFSRSTSTPFKSDISSGVIPDQDLLTGEVGWFQLLETSSGA